MLSAGDHVGSASFWTKKRSSTPGCFDVLILKRVTLGETPAWRYVVHMGVFLLTPLDMIGYCLRVRRTRALQAAAEIVEGDWHANPKPRLVRRSDHLHGCGSPW